MFQKDIGEENGCPQTLSMSKLEVETSRRGLSKHAWVPWGLLGRQSQRKRDTVCRQSESDWTGTLDLSEGKEIAMIIYIYSGGDKTSVKTLTAYISFNKAKYPINLGAKWKLLISRFQNSPWMLDLELNWRRYDRKTEPNLNCKKVSNESYF